MPIQFQLPSLYRGQDTFIGPDGLLGPVVDLFVGYMVLVASFHIGFSLVRVAFVWTILEMISVLDLSSVTIEPS